MTTPAVRCCPCPPPGNNAGFLLCDCPPTGECTQFIRIFTASGSYVDRTLDNAVYAPTGEVGACCEDSGGSAPPTTPIAATGLCLADGTPIAVVVQRDADGMVSAPGWVNLLTSTYTPGPVPAGAGTCDQVAANACDQTTPITTTGVCLADGTPIATVATRDCDGVITQDGWINLRTGAFTTGLPPAGTVACGAGQSIQVSGVFCDIDADGDVLALVLVEYTYDEAGAIESVRLVRADDGTTYELVGTLSICPGTGTAMDIEGALLCLRDAAGELIQQVWAEYGHDTTTGERLFVRFTDPTSGAVIAPPAGATVGECTDPCERCETLVLCHTVPETVDTSEATVTVTAQAPATSGVPLNYGGPIAAPLPDAAAFFSGGAANVGPNAINEHVYMVGAAAVDPDCGDLDPAGTSELTITARIDNTGASCGCGLWGRFTVWNTATTPATNLAASLPAPNQDGNLGALNDAANFSICPGEVWTPTRTVTVPNSAILAGTVKVEINVQTGTDTTPDGAGCPVNIPGGTTYTLDQFAATVTPVPVTGCTATDAGTATPFLRHVCRACDGTVTTTDTEMDGVTDYDASTGTVGVCAPDSAADAECAGGCETETLCNLDRDVAAVLASVGSDATAEEWHTLSNGVRWQRDGNTAGVPGGWYPAGANAETFRLDRPAEVRYEVRFSSGTAAPVKIPAGWVLDTIVAGHTWNAATRTLTPGPAATNALVSSFKPAGLTTTLMDSPTIVGTQPAGQTSQYGQITVTADVLTSFLRTTCRACDGSITSTVTTAMDGVTVYDPPGEVGSCDLLAAQFVDTEECLRCSERVLCDNPGTTAFPSTILGPGSTGTLPNGVTWTARGNAGVASATEVNADGAWWGLGSFPNLQTTPYTWTFSRPVDVVYSIGLQYNATLANRQVRVPLGSEPVSLPPGYLYDAAAGIVEAAPSLSSCPPITDPAKSTSARFRLKAVTSFTLAYLGSRIVACNQFGNYRLGGIDVTPATTQFLRTVCRNCHGEIVGEPTDTTLDGATPYAVVGTAGACEDCQDCETVTLCDVSGDPTEWAPVDQVGINGATTVAGNGIRTGLVVSNGALAGGTAPDTGFATWTLNNVSSTAGITVDQPAQIRFLASITAGTTVRLPVGAVVERLAPNHSYNATQHVLTGLAGAQVGGTGSAGFDTAANLSTVYIPRTAGNRADFAAVVVVTTGAPNTFGFDNIELAPAEPIEFARTVCRDCQGNPLTAPVDTLLDGVTPYLVGGTVMDCARAAAPEPCCQPVQVCITPTRTETLHFVTNNTNPVEVAGQPDAVWTWRLESEPETTAWPTYHGPPNPAWTVQDTHPTIKANWVTPHPNSSTATTGAPGEGPTLAPLPLFWIAKASFQLPANADPASIRVEATIIAADQEIRGYRLNGGAWIETGTPAGTPSGNYQPPAFTFPAQALAGAQAGTNVLELRVRETTPGPDAGIKAHLIVTYQVPDGGQRSWTRMVCCNDTVYYLDESGTRHDSIPELWQITPCGADLSVDAPMRTGIRRLTGDTPVQNLGVEFPGLQSVTLTVLAGQVNTAMTSGAAQVPADTSLTWSVTDDDDNALAGATFDGAAGADYLLSWTYKPTSAG